jgi:hypothetical protein
MTADAEYLIRLRPLADARPEDVRVRLALKHALRSQRLECVSAEKVPTPPKPIPHGVYSRLPGAAWRLVKKVTSRPAIGGFSRSATSSAVAWN